jgi:hypothetical protein
LPGKRKSTQIKERIFPVITGKIKLEVIHMAKPKVFLAYNITFSINGLRGFYTFYNPDNACAFLEYCWHEPLVSGYALTRWQTTETHFRDRIVPENKENFNDETFDKILSFNKKLI